MKVTMNRIRQERIGKDLLACPLTSRLFSGSAGMNFLRAGSNSLQKRQPSMNKFPVARI